MGPAIAAFGFEVAQALGRSGVAVLYAVSITLIFRSLGIGTISGLLVIVVFYLLDQSILGGEWLFGGIEPKTIAYPFVFLGFWAALQGRYMWAYVALAAATYFHFLVGGFWFLAVAAGQLWYGRDWRKTLTSVVVYSLLCAPLLLVVVGDHLNAVGEAATLPSADWIYSIYRVPHHVSPFSSLSRMSKWLPGIALLGAISSTVVVIWLTGEKREKTLAILVFLLCLFFFVALVLSFLDRESGAFGKFYLFRPASVTLLAFLCLVAIYLNRRITSNAGEIRVLALALLATVVLSDVVDDVKFWRGARGPPTEDQERLADVIATQVQRDDVVLIEPTIEWQWLHFERVYKRPMLVAWKFNPTTGKDIQRWYELKRMRDQIFKKGCDVATNARVDYLLSSSSTAHRLEPQCGSLVFMGQEIALIAMNAPGR